MTFSDIFKKNFLNTFLGNEITVRSVSSVMLACLLISLVICVVYYFRMRKYFYSKEFALSIVALSMITAAVILTIQSSIVISLGMVGALSIVRFRTAVKNPLDLVFLFWSIAVGIICGAGLYYIAILLTLILGIVVLISDDIPGIPGNKLLVINGRYPYDREKLEEILGRHVKWWNVRTESTHNEDFNIIIELRRLKDQSHLINEIRDMEGVSDVSVLVREGAVD